MAQTHTLVIGAGQAAAAFVRAVRDHGHAGAVTVVGEEPHAPYERPPLSKSFLTEVPAPAPVHFIDPDGWHAHGVDLQLGRRVDQIDLRAGRAHLDGGTTIAFDRLVIATGGSARRAGVGLTLRTLADAMCLSERLSRSRSICVVGGGFLGLEIAASARTRGLDVTVLEAAARLLPLVMPAELSEWLRGLHASRGTAIHCGAGVESMEESRDGRFIVCAPPLAVESDCLVTAIGMEPNTRLAERAGLQVRGGIVVDEQCRTSAPGVWAIGDVACMIDPLDGRCRRIESWQNAEYHGALVAAQIAGVAPPAKPVPWFWTEQYGTSIQVFGDLTGGDLVWRGTPAQGAFVAVQHREGRIVGGVGVNAGKEIPPLRQLVGLQAPISQDEVAQARTLRDLLAKARG